jgi:hypothetical protein
MEGHQNYRLIISKKRQFVWMCKKIKTDVLCDVLCAVPWSLSPVEQASPRIPVKAESSAAPPAIRSILVRWLHIGFERLGSLAGSFSAYTPLITSTILHRSLHNPTYSTQFPTVLCILKYGYGGIPGVSPLPLSAASL